MTIAAELDELSCSNRAHAGPADAPPDLQALAWVWRQAGQLAPMQQFVWTHACARAFARPGSLRLTAAPATRPASVAPLVQSRRWGVAQLEMLGVAQLHEPMDLVYSDADSLDALARAIVRMGRVAYLGRVPANSPSVAAVRRACRGRAVLIVRPQATCPYIPLDESWREPESHLNSGRRCDLRRARRKAEQLGEVTSEVLWPTPDELEPLLAEAFRIEASGWKGEAGTALARDERLAAFFRTYAALAAEQGILRLAFLNVGQRRVAMQLAVETGGGFWLLKVGYDNEFAACSPGVLLMRDTIAYSAERGLASYEMLGKSDSWTSVWTSHERAHVSLRIYPLRPAGLWALACDAIAKALARRSATK